ncbi:MAG TPA: hypothetical protein VH092_04580, partial [Urbifossiella sp.]|nr:hypothetical protein [Urbifossiella sp.]
MGEQLLWGIGFLVAWVGHACVWTAVLNHAYGRPFSKAFLKPLRLVTGAVIAGFPALPLVESGWPVWGYVAVCLLFGGLVFPAITVYRLIRPRPAELVSETTATLDVRAEIGEAVAGDGKWWWVSRLPLNDIYRVDFTDWTLAVQDLPQEWQGLTILLLSDVHFHGTPSRAFYERVLKEIETRWPVPDLVCLAGDYVDTDTHHAW